ncbi:DUF397 domain-containing protein [Streptomyces murinus]|uniref:DUF397 domain-containing protein n=1 Tax=Streptomyces TaxID=1883 RepID=UPI00109C247E|nr:MULTISPECIES: DUF397 domain-containing protein [Streptomyces]TGZ17454.1 DUF397 domain-containing protein [Streptomyces sp. S816]TXJ73911.1 DUF397 domain-containing protein [Streptomyces lavendulae]
MSTPELHWFKSTYSDGNDPGDCVEVAATPATVHVRDSKTPHTAHLTVAPSAWVDFVAQVGGHR